MQAITYLATSSPKAAPDRRTVSRTWSRNGDRCTVQAQHPQLGLMYRGTIRRTTSQLEDGALSRWTVTDADYTDLPPVVGDYLDAERALLDATAALDEPVPVELLAE